MSNTRKCRELHGGRMTRPRYQWAGKKRGSSGSPFAATMLAAPLGRPLRPVTPFTAALQRKAGGGDR